MVWGPRARANPSTTSSYVKFDTSSIPKDAIITSATLSLYLESGSRWAEPYGNAKIGAHRCDQDQGQGQDQGQDQAWNEHYGSTSRA